MEFLRRNWMQLRAFLADLTPSQKWLIGAIVIILLFTLFFVLQYAAAPQMTPITQFASDRQPDVMARLVSAGIDVQEKSGQLYVPVTQQADAQAVLAMSDLLANDTSKAFTDLIQRQSPWLSPQQNQQAFLVAQQQVLSQVIAKMKGVRSADVMISIPENERFGKSFVRPSASVNIVMQGAGHVDRTLVEAVAGLVSGAVAQMGPRDVTVVDARAGRSFTVDSPDEISGERKLADLKNYEEHYLDKVRTLLSYIPGVIVAVQVQMDSVIKRQSEKWEYDKTEPLVRQSETETSRVNTGQAGAPGARSNTGADIEGASTAGSTEKSSNSETEFGPKPLTARNVTQEAGQSTTQINVSVAVPRSYLVDLYKQRNPDKQADTPDDTALASIKDELLPQVEGQVKPLINTDKMAGIVKATIVYDSALAFDPLRGGPGGSGGVSNLLTGSMGTYISLGLLGLVSMVIMLGMVRRAMKNPPLPSVEELAGMPPTLPEDEEELIGEVPEHDAAMPGVEVNEQEIHLRQLTDQIAELVKNNPEESAGLFNRWVRPED